MPYSKAFKSNAHIKIIAWLIIMFFNLALHYTLFNSIIYTSLL